MRKEISTKENREYGYVRWYSQLKKLQRLSGIYPALFPKILHVGHTSDTAYFDLEYLNGFTDCKTLLVAGAVNEKKLNAAIWRAFDQIHACAVPTAPGLPNLYFQEEVKQKLDDACKFKLFSEFIRYPSYVYFGTEVPNLELNLISDYFSGVYLSECHTHGNPTLENMMYSPEEDRVMFIDLYEESIIDSAYLDLAQVLQCSRSHYGYINDRSVIVSGNEVSHSLVIPASFQIFNELYTETIMARHLDIELLNVLEATQFIRMLPFKCAAGEIDKAKFFYVHACYLLNGIFNGIS